MGTPVLLQHIHERTATVAVVGLGYVGLPVAVAAANAGFSVVGYDVSEARTAQLMAGDSYVLDISNDELGAVLAAGRFRATSDPEEVGQADVIVICVPTPLRDDLPDMSYIEAAGNLVAKGLKPGRLVILESTTYPGTTEELLKGILETSGLKCGQDFSLGFSPERIDPGNTRFKLENVPKVVGGFDADATSLMKAFYSSFVHTVVTVSSPRTAEMAKLLENTYRHVNIALVNEIAILCHDLGIDVWEVITAAATKPFGYQPFYPGPGWGGHCIPVDPAYLSWRVRQLGDTAHFIDLAREINNRMPVYVVQRIAEALNEEGKSLKGSAVLILGVAYKPDVGDLRESPALDVIARLRKSGANVSFHDPYVGSIRLET
ncbi:MAG TPA: nucleotide sugar dehydrogenase, partial [Actinomycetota bacterium]|nr:nucleotide sugar dehydrogenase [Actinomycetota bacterium]